MSAVIGQHEVHGHDAHGHGHHPYGWRRWLFATNHKDIGTMYLWFSFTMFIVGGLNALLLRTELDEEQYARVLNLLGCAPADFPK